MNTFTLFIFILAITLNALANIFIKASALYSKDNTILGLLTNPWLIIGLVSFGLAFIFYRYVLSKGIPLSIAYPVMTTSGFAIVILASKFFFNEKLIPIQWIGIGFLILGIWLITSKI